ncbi:MULTISPECIES: LysE family transporter [unclassified Paenibacillus]|uniref:LysE family transporter n=1 Tax=unclassified Paenibacillus TaxID=185978 RepID=UPI0036C1468E
MNITLWISFFAYAITTALSPGPNNILALNEVSTYGLKKSKPLLLGIYTGFLAVMILCGFFSVILGRYLPGILIYLKYVGSMYILYLAFRTITSKPAKNEDQESGSSSFLRGFILQFVNVKIILWGLTVFIAYILPYYSSYPAIAGFILLSAAIGNGATHVWVIAGVLLHNVINNYWRVVNVIMALLLVYSAINLLLD